MTTEFCTRCGVNPRTETGNSWCKACRADYAKGYLNVRLNRKEATGFVKGREAMRRLIAEEFAKLPAGQFFGADVVALVERMPGPQVVDAEGQEGNRG